LEEKFPILGKKNFRQDYRIDWMRKYNPVHPVILSKKCTGKTAVFDCCTDLTDLP
jgi:hypothetical protein